MVQRRIAVTEEWVPIDGSDVLVRQHGDGDPVLLINGIGSHTGMWAPVEQKWSSHRVISFDAPGVGRSPNRVPPTSIPGIAEVARGVLDHVGVDRADVVGYSLGGAVAQTLARRHPERVARLVLAGTTTGAGAVTGSWNSVVHVLSPMRYYSQAYFELTIGSMAGGQARHNPQFVYRHGKLRREHRPNVWGYYEQVVALMWWSSLHWLSEIEAPTLVVTGDDDPLVPSVNSYILASRIPEARLVVSPDDGHLFLFDTESPMLPVIQEFLSAPTHETSRTWSEAQTVTPEEERALIDATPPGLFPLGMQSAVYRRLVDQFKALAASATIPSFPSREDA